MNFFEQQEHARRQTRKLVILFILAVIAIVIAVNLALALLWSWTTSGYVLGMRDYPRGFFATNSAIVLAMIAGGTLIEMLVLREGGEAVARMAGGRLVSPSTADPQERRLINVVEEMALASGVACPRVYILDQEQAINAFAAGYNQDQAVIGVTRGTLERLTRDELQGVVAHEFSHILNGDMRLNIRLIGLLFGIQMLAGFGQHLMRFGSYAPMARSRDQQGNQARIVLLLTGVALFVIGYIGVFFGRLIKSAVSRQREFLADASAVQFTRNPDGIGGALRKIGGLSQGKHPGSHIAHPNAEQLSHLFLGAPRASMLSGWLATHPPIADRLQRIYGRRVALLDAPVLPSPAPPARELPDIPYVTAGFDSGAAPDWAAAAPHTQALPVALDEAAHEPFGACALVYALLLDDNPSGRTVQMGLLQQNAPQQAQLVPALIAALARMPRSARLPLLDRAMPALLLLTPAQRAVLLALADKLIVADRRRTLAEFVIETVLVRRLGPHAARPTPVRYDDLRAIRDECALLLSLVAHVGAANVAAGADDLFVAGARACPQLQLDAQALRAAEAVDFEAVRAALERAHELAPLAKPQLVKALMAAGGRREPMPVALADLMRAICAAIEAPVPPAVAATYTAHHWVSAAAAAGVTDAAAL